MLSLEFEKYSSSKCVSNWSVQKNYPESLLKMEMQFRPSGMALGSALLTRPPGCLDVEDHSLRRSESRIWVWACWAVGLIPGWLGPCWERRGHLGQEAVWLPTLLGSLSSSLSGMSCPSPTELVLCPRGSVYALTCQGLQLRAIYF